MILKSAKKRTGFDELNDKLDRVIDTMATKEDIVRLDGRMDRLEIYIDTRVGVVERRITDLDAKFDRKFNDVMTAIDGLAKAISDLAVEYAAVKMQLARHEAWLKLLAEKTGVTLPS